MTIEEAFEELENYIDASDPDLDLVSQAVKRTLSHGLEPNLLSLIT